MDEVAGLEKLAKALAWLSNQDIEGDIGDIQTLLTDFYVSCSNPKPGDYLNFLRGIKYHTPGDQNLLCTAFFKAYDIPDNHFEPKVLKTVPRQSSN